MSDSGRGDRLLVPACKARRIAPRTAPHTRPLHARDMIAPVFQRPRRYRLHVGEGLRIIAADDPPCLLGHTTSPLGCRIILVELCKADGTLAVARRIYGFTKSGANAHA